MFEAGEGELEDDEGGGEFPGVEEVGGGEDAVAVVLAGNGDGALPQGTLGIEAATVEEVFVEGEEGLLEAANRGGGRGERSPL
ncbi:MAG: hypothetical protein JSV69_04420 [Chloroflexota bacterium]|nr:MAG: hypothetical protein JSV69_04420 [Chloroflexota bacterium]